MVTISIKKYSVSVCAILDGSTILLIETLVLQNLQKTKFKYHETICTSRCIFEEL